MTKVWFPEKHFSGGKMTHARLHGGWWYLLIFCLNCERQIKLMPGRTDRNLTQNVQSINESWAQLAAHGSSQFWLIPWVWGWQSSGQGQLQELTLCRNPVLQPHDESKVSFLLWAEMGEGQELIKQQLIEIWSEKFFALLFSLKSQWVFQASFSSLLNSWHWNHFSGPL